MSVGGSLHITLLASEWKSSKGGLSTLNRELAIQLAKHPNVSVSFFVPKCSDEDRRAAKKHNVNILEAEEMPGYEPTDWLPFPPKDLEIDFVVGNGVILGKQAQIIRKSHFCKWMQVVHTAPEQLGMHKTYSGAVAKGGEKQSIEIKLCEMADLVVAVGPKLKEIYSAYLNYCDKDVFNLTPDIFTELCNLKGCVPWDNSAHFRVLLFGRSDSEDFLLKGFDIAAKAIASLNDKSVFLSFVGAYEPDEIAEKFKSFGLSPDQLSVRSFVESRDDLAKVLCSVSLSIIPSRTEGFGLTALEALSACVPFLVSQNSGFGKAIQEIGPSFVVQSDDPKDWAEAIKGVRQKGSERVIKECRELRARYAERYSWEKQCKDLVARMQALAHAPDQTASSLLDETAGQQIETDNPGPVTKTLEAKKPYDEQGARPKERSSSSEQVSSLSNQGNEESEVQSPIVMLLQQRAEVSDKKVKEEQLKPASKSKQPVNVTSDQTPSSFSDGTVGRQIETENSGPVTKTMEAKKPYDEQGSRPKERFSSPEQVSSSSNPGNALKETLPKPLKNSTDSRCSPGASYGPLRSREKKEQQQAKPKQRSDPPRRGELYEEKKPEYEHPAVLHGQWTGKMKKAPETKMQQKPGIRHPLQLVDHLEEKKPEYRCTSSSHGQENPPPFPRRTKIVGLSALGWNTKPESLSAVNKLIQEHRDQLKLDDNPGVYNADLQELISYLENNPLTYCVLVVDAEIVSTVAREGVADYLRLLEAAERNVEDKIIVIVCCPLCMSKEDDNSLDDAIQRALNDSDKLFFARLRNGELTIRGDDLLFLFTSSFAGHYQQQSHASGSQQILGLGTSQLHAQVNSTTGLSQGFQNQTGCSYNRQCAPELQAAATANKQFYPAVGSFNYKLEFPPLKTIMVLTRLRYGRISNRVEDIEYWKPGFIVPNHMERYLLNHFCKKNDVELAILQERDELVSLVDKKIEKQQLLKLELDEFVVLKTRLKNGRISYEPKHIVFRSRLCEVPRDASSKLRQDYGTIDDAELFVTSDSEGNFRQCIVRIDTRFERLKSRVQTLLDRFQGKCN